MYRVKTISFGTLDQQIKYVDKEIFGAKFSLKGFEYPWILSTHKWKKGERVLDVGAGYSNLPMHIADTYGCDVWAVDDFGLSSDEPFWKRHLDPDEHIKEHPKVTFVKERLGNQEESSLPNGTFDCIFSASALEHVPNHLILPVWQHMHALLKPGGELIHGIDMQFPINRGLLSVGKAILLDTLFPLLPKGLKVEFAYFTPSSYVRHISKVLGRNFSFKEIRTFKMITDPAVIIDSPNFFYNRYKENPGRKLKIRRNTALLIHLVKES